ncbi:MAG: D-alanine/D-alanine ligase [Lacrimispora sp.]|jgi:D-alanine-D-alanine ligase|nr:D-alanine/D-alanine ligase [Lacrimispora sp.]
MKIAVLAGGYSPEREVSLSSGAMITNALMEQGHEVCLVDSYLGIPDGEEIRFYRLGDGMEFSSHIGSSAPDLEDVKQRGGFQGIMGSRVMEACMQSEMVFLALHGGAGENGQIQAILDGFGIPYTGTGFEGCLKAMDKHLAKLIMREENILTPEWRLYEKGSQTEPFVFPCVVKPCGCGSSVGVTMVEDEGQWKKALDTAFSCENTVLAEAKISGREFSVGILGGTALPAIEIKPMNGFYDYENKYQPGKTEEICPASLSKEEAEHMSDLSLKVHKVLSLGYYSRVDFMMEEDGSIYCLEANTLPGMTPYSLLPQEAKAAGISYQELCDLIVRNGKGALE